MFSHEHLIFSRAVKEQHIKSGSGYITAKSVKIANNVFDVEYPVSSYTERESTCKPLGNTS